MCESSERLVEELVIQVSDMSHFLREDATLAFRAIRRLEKEVAAIREATCPPAGATDLSLATADELWSELKDRLIKGGLTAHPWIFADSAGRVCVSASGRIGNGYGETVTEAIKDFIARMGEEERTIYRNLCASGGTLCLIGY